MKIINNVATLCMAFGLTVFAGSFLFGSGSLGVLGWVITLPLFVGASAHTAISVYNLLPERKKDAKADEKQGIKPEAQPA